MTGSQSVPRSWSYGLEWNFQDSEACNFVRQEQTSGEVHPSLPSCQNMMTPLLVVHNVEPGNTS